jgi:hypothetical protein
MRTHSSPQCAQDGGIGALGSNLCPVGFQSFFGMIILSNFYFSVRNRNVYPIHVQPLVLGKMQFLLSFILEGLMTEKNCFKSQMKLWTE